MLRFAQIVKQTLFLSLVIVLISGCGTTRKQSLFSGQDNVGDFEVSWDHVPVFDERVADGLTPLIFNFFSTLPENKTRLSETEWAEVASELGWQVSITKVAYGKDAYFGPDGKLRKCTIFAVQKGLCGQKLGLSIEQRVQMAKQLLETSEECEWVSFDGAYHARAAFDLGAQDFTLHVPAKCSSL